MYMLLRSRRQKKTAVFCLHFRYPAQKCLQSAVHVSKLNMKDTLWSSGHVFGGWAGSVAAAGMPTCQHAPLSQADDTLQQWQRGSRLSFWAMRSGAQQISSTWESKAVSCNMLHYVCGGSWADQCVCHSYVSLLEVARGGEADLVPTAIQILAARQHNVALCSATEGIYLKL